MERKTLDEKVFIIDPLQLRAVDGVQFTKPLRVRVELVENYSNSNSSSYSVYVDSKHEVTRFDRGKAEDEFQRGLDKIERGDYEIHIQYGVSFEGAR